MNILDLSSGVCAGAAAVFWFLSAAVKVPKVESIAAAIPQQQPVSRSIGIRAGKGAAAAVWVDVRPFQALSAALRRQAVLSKLAAFAAAMAALLQMLTEFR